MLIDPGAVANILPPRILSWLQKTIEDTVPTNIMVKNFVVGTTMPMGLLTTQVYVGKRRTMAVFFVVYTSTSFRELLARDWIYINGYVPTSLHQTLFFITQEGDEGRKPIKIYWADSCPFTADTNSTMT